jgi:hypothetical protein
LATVVVKIRGRWVRLESERKLGHEGNNQKALNQCPDPDIKDIVSEIVITAGNGRTKDSGGAKTDKKTP